MHQYYIEKYYSQVTLFLRLTSKKYIHYLNSFVLLKTTFLYIHRENSLHLYSLQIKIANQTLASSEKSRVVNLILIRPDSKNGIRIISKEIYRINYYT
jgi:hypothetical protein